MAREVMLTTLDNPWDPFTHWDEWYQFDEAAGYHTSGLLARVAVIGDELSDSDRELAVEDAINEIISENVSGMHKKVYQDIK